VYAEAMQGALSRMSFGKFWIAVDELVATSEVVIDRPKGSRHPKITEAMTMKCVEPSGRAGRGHR
jgi:hypothetical protein